MKVRYLFFVLLGGLLLVTNCNQKKPAKESLDWAQGIVWYQIFPERFSNGSTLDDPTAAEVPGAEKEPGWQIHPWTSDWYKLQPWEKAYSDTFYNVVFTRRYGGDLIGVINKLDYLQTLGVDAIYFNPVFEAPSLHKYDAAMYHHIDDNFGPAPQRDKTRIAKANENENPSSWIWTSADSTFLRLIEEAHKRGIKIVIDGVFNHTGVEFFAMKDLQKNGKNSRYANWYEVKSWDDPSTPENEFDYEGWWGYKGLPVFKEDENGLVKGPREYIFNITRRWMDPNNDGDPSDGIDGWRLDVMQEVAPPFWRDWHQLVKSLNPNALTVAEIWDDASEWIRDKRVDATMNYLFARATKRFFANKDSTITGNEFANRIDEIQSTYGDNTTRILWNLMDSHDTDRLASMIVNPDNNYDRDNSPRWNPDYKVRKPLQEERQIQKQILAFQMTYIGSPMLYYGDEAGMWGGDDPDDRKPMVWPDMTFEAEKTHPLPEHTRPSDPNYFDQTLFLYTRNLITLRHEHPAISQGDYRSLPAITTKQIYGFERRFGKDQFIALFNSADSAQTVALPKNILDYNSYTDPMTAAKYSVHDGVITILVPSRWYVFLSAGEKR